MGFQTYFLYIFFAIGSNLEVYDAKLSRVILTRRGASDGTPRDVQKPLFLMKTTFCHFGSKKKVLFLKKKSPNLGHWLKWVFPYVFPISQIPIPISPIPIPRFSIPIPVFPIHIPIFGVFRPIFLVFRPIFWAFGVQGGPRGSLDLSLLSLSWDNRILFCLSWAYLGPILFVWPG